MPYGTIERPLVMFTKWSLKIFATSRSSLTMLSSSSKKIFPSLVQPLLEKYGFARCQKDLSLVLVALNLNIFASYKVDK